jgi:(1->4)-alpha-D-glucan 1-alpha-D-glucosylmutase
MIKAVREAKLRSTWAMPDQSYEDAITSFVADALDPQRPAFIDEFLPFARQIAALGIQNSLAQTLFKLTAPGVPDIYQGAELWDLSMVDPDNRRPVDYALRARLLDEIDRDLARDPRAAFAAYLSSWQDGRVKLALVARLLRTRGDHADLFVRGGYEGLEARGPQADQICAYARHFDGDRLIAAGLRFPARRFRQPLSEATTLVLPEGSWTDLLTGAVHAGEGSVAALFEVLPVAVLVAA